MLRLSVLAIANDEVLLKIVQDDEQENREMFR
jgi:hypothetical protein